MKRAFIVAAGVLLGVSQVGFAQDRGEEKRAYPSFDYDAARTHELKPHRRAIPHQGVTPGFNQLHLSLVISPAGEVVSAKAEGDARTLKIWPDVETEVNQWKFEPFLKGGAAVTAEVEEYLDLVPPERIPKTHVAAPEIRPNSDVAITLERSRCFGTCPSYSVAVTTEGIVFDGRVYVVAQGRHTGKIDPDAVRKLAKQLVDADFYSLDARYVASVTDSPSYELTLSIDGRSKGVLDYVGALEGMPSIVTDLEDEVDLLAGVSRWVEGTDGLVPLLQAEKYNFKTYEAQEMLKAAASRGQAATVGQLLAAGVPLTLLTRPEAKDPHAMVSIAEGWLTAAAAYPDVLQILLSAQASGTDQRDKDLALNVAAGSGSLAAVRALIAYGANPNVDLGKMTVSLSSGGMTLSGPGSGSILIAAAGSGNPEVVREILRYHPSLEAKYREGKTAIFAAAEHRSKDVNGARVECVRLLARAGANVNARDDEGNTVLHVTFLTDVAEELLRLGADVNARNHDGETPIFTTYDDASIPLFILHGADLTVRNNKGQTVLEAAENKGPVRQEILRKAIQHVSQRQ